jgi:hypothetical protein
VCHHIISSGFKLVYGSSAKPLGKVIVTVLRPATYPICFLYDQKPAEGIAYEVLREFGTTINNEFIAETAPEMRVACLRRSEQVVTDPVREY